MSFCPPKLSCYLNNLRQLMMNRKIFFYYDKKLKLFFVIENKLRMYFPDKMRGFETYSYGISYRANQLAKTYNIDQIKFNEQDYVIDCGANYGDIFTWFKINNLKINYISFEPSPNEFECIKLNCFQQKNYNLALSNSEGRMDFFLKTDTGDSSIIEPSLGYIKKITVNTITLEKFIIDKNLKKIKLFKLEAEGFEPEILKGSMNILNRIEYIGVDGSPERGKDNETTIEFAMEFLLKNEFEVVYKDINKNFAKALFRNKNLKV